MNKKQKIIDYLEGRIKTEERSIDVCLEGNLEPSLHYVRIKAYEELIKFVKEEM